MKKLLVTASLSLWFAALSFTPAPAEAFWARYSTIVSYLSCAQYTTMSPQYCLNNNQDQVKFSGYMANTVPTSACSGSCNGSASLLVGLNPGNGRKKTDSVDAQCGNAYIMQMSPCTSCS